MVKAIEHRMRAGVIMTVVGATALVCIGFFWFFGGRLLYDDGIQFEPEQLLAESASSITIPGFESMTIEAGQTTVSTYLYNPESNTCYFEILIHLTETDETIYASKLVAPGQELYEIELTRELEEGDYRAIVEYRAYAAGTFTELNGANVPFDLHVIA